MTDRGIHRSRSGAAAAVLAATLLAPPSALALDTLKITAPAAPGGGWDQTARNMQAVLQAEGIVKRVEVDNKPGAGGTIGLAALVNTQKGEAGRLMMSGMVMVGAILTNKSPVTLQQVTPIARLTGEYEALAVPTNSKIKSLKDLMDAFKKDPGAVSWAGGSRGGADHILVGLLAQAVGVDPTKINYIAHSGGGESLAAILGGHVTVGVNGLAEFMGQLEAGKLRALGVSSDKRIPGVDIPTFKEQGVNVEFANWRAVVAPPGISDADKKALVGVVDKLAKSKGWQDVLKKQNWTDFYLSGDAFGKYLADEDMRIGNVLKTVGLVK
jgi:putative tricarboxylic transport membrane protein